MLGGWSQRKVVWSSSQAGAGMPQRRRRSVRHFCPFCAGGVARQYNVADFDIDRCKAAFFEIYFSRYCKPGAHARLPGCCKHAAGSKGSTEAVSRRCPALAGRLGPSGLALTLCLPLGHTVAHACRLGHQPQGGAAAGGGLPGRGPQDGSGLERRPCQGAWAGSLHCAALCAAMLGCPSFGAACCLGRRCMLACSPSNQPCISTTRDCQVDAQLMASDIPQSLFDAVVSADAFENLKPSPGVCTTGRACRSGRGHTALNQRAPVPSAQRTPLPPCRAPIPLAFPTLPRLPSPASTYRQTSFLRRRRSWACLQPTVW